MNKNIPRFPYFILDKDLHVAGKGATEIVRAAVSHHVRQRIKQEDCHGDPDHDLSDVCLFKIMALNIINRLSSS